MKDCPAFIGLFGTFAFSWVGLTVIPNLQIGILIRNRMKKARTFIQCRNREWPRADAGSTPPTAVFIAIASNFGPITPPPISIANGGNAAARRAITFSTAGAAREGTHGS